MSCLIFAATDTVIVPGSLIGSGATVMLPTTTRSVGPPQVLHAQCVTRGPTALFCTGNGQHPNWSLY